MKKVISFVFVVTFSISLSLPMALASPVPPEITQRCAKKWGTDYEMQAYCQKKQLEAYHEIRATNQSLIDNTMVQGIQAANRVGAKRGLKGLNNAVNKCYGTIKILDNLRYCIALDFVLAKHSFSNQNQSAVTARRVILQITKHEYLGSSYLHDSWLEKVIAAHKVAMH